MASAQSHLVVMYGVERLAKSIYNVYGKLTAIAPHTVAAGPPPPPHLLAAHLESRLLQVDSNQLDQFFPSIHNSKVKNLTF